MHGPGHSDAVRRGETAAKIGAPRFELGTSPTRTVRATRLRHAPKTAQSIGVGLLHFSGARFLQLGRFSSLNSVVLAPGAGGRSRTARKAKDQEPRMRTRLLL